MGFDDANGRIGVVGRGGGGSDNGAAWKRETKFSLFFPFFLLEKGLGVDQGCGCRIKYGFAAAEDEKSTMNEQRRRGVGKMV